MTDTPKSIFDRYKIQAFNDGIAPRTQESLKWFKTVLSKLSRVSREGILNDPNTPSVSTPLPGRMFTYFYDPKFKETLPYYDRFPLIIMLEAAAGGFHGLNLHYLAPQERMVFFANLMEFKNNKKYDETTRFQLNYSMLKGASKLRAFKPCFKRYLTSQIKSQVVEIQPKEWELAIFLPTDQFVYKTRRTVWKKSAEMI
jgi:hypothetical protein